MISLTSKPLSSSSLPLLRTPGSGFSSTSSSAFKLTNKNLRKRRIQTGECRAQLIEDAPLAATIGACMLSSLVLPNAPAALDEEEEDGAAMSSFDVKFAVMGILTFIPYFNWLSWIFAWMDTGKRRYVVYALVYLAPYIRSNMSLSTDESWLPLASIIFCIIHVQLEASIRNGDIQPFQFLGGASKRSPSLTRTKSHQEEFYKEGHNNLPSSDSKPRDEIEWDLPQKPIKDRESLNEDQDGDHRRNH